jgi:hypothetical protein
MAAHWYGSFRFRPLGLGCALALGAGCGSSASAPSIQNPVVVSPTAGTGTSGTPTAQAGTTAALGGAGTGSVVKPGTPVGTTAGTSAAIAAAGTAAPIAAAGTTGAAPSAGAGGAAADAGTGMAMDECGLHTQYAGDEYCILPPPPDKGFQMHIGPTNYDNPEAQYLLTAGQEITNDFNTTSTNTKSVYFYYRQYRMRNGAHHNIITTTGAGAATGVDLGRRIGTVNVLSQDSPKGGIIAPENVGVGIPLDANSPIDVSLHSINTSDKTELREIWVNFWYRDPSLVTEPTEEMFQTGDPTFSIAPHQDTILGPYTCAVQGTGRMLWFYGHRHANNVRFSAWRIRGAQKDLFYEGFNWEEPLTLEYASTVTNSPPDDSKMIEGGWSGILDFQAGDTIQWECHVINQTDGTLRFTNNTYTGEMCIMDAELVGANCP